MQDLESKEPPFLRRLKNEHGGRNSERHDLPIARSLKQKSEKDDDNEPLYIHEETQNTVSKDEFNAFLDFQANVELVTRELSPPWKSQSSIAHEGSLGEIERAVNIPVSKQQEAIVGGNLKKRTAKIIVADFEDEITQEKNASSCKRRTCSSTKKGGKVKLSFDEDPQTQ